MPKLKVSDSKMRERGYVIRKAETTTGKYKYKEYVNGLFKIAVLESDGVSEPTIHTNNDHQKHDIDLDELEYLEEIYK